MAKLGAVISGVSKKRLLSLLAFGLFFGSVSQRVFANPSQDLFQRLLTAKDSAVTTASCEKASDYQYVFVAGIFNELMPYYFKDEIDWLLTCKVPKAQVQLARPYSGTGLSRSSDSLKDLFRQMLANHPDKHLIIIGHSKGAPEALLASLESPDEVQKKISSVVSIQGSFGGSPIADLALGDDNLRGATDYRLVAKIARRLSGWLRRVERIYGKSVRDGVYSVRTSEARSFWPTFIKIKKNENILSDSKVLVLQTYKHYRRLNPFFFLSGEYLNRLTGEPTDGAIPFSSQRPPIDGVRPAVLELDHLDTVLPRAFSFSDPSIRYQLIASIIGAQ